MRLSGQFGGLPAPFWTVWWGTLVNRAGDFVVPFLAFYLTAERHVSPMDAGFIVSLYGAGALVASLVGGVLADRLGRRATMLVGLGGGGTCMLALGFAEDLATISAGVFVVALVSNVYRPAVQAFVADVVPGPDRLRAYGVLYWAINVGFSIAPVLAGLLAEYGYRWLFIADAATTLLYAAIAAWRVPETRPVPTPTAASARALGLGAIFRDGVFITFAGLTFFLGAIFQQAQAAMPLDMAANGLTPAQAGRVLAVNGLVIVLLQPFAMPLIRRFRSASVLAAASILTGLGFASNGLVSTAPLYAMAVVVWTLGEIASAPVSSSIVAELAPPELRGRYQGTYTMSFGVAAMLAPLAGTFVIEHHGSGALWVGCAVLGVLIALGHLAAAGPRSRRSSTRSGANGPRIAESVRRKRTS